jgi:hypothetical protein
MKRSSFVISLVAVIVLGSVPANSAVKAKAGAKCSKLGLTQTVSGKKFTCIKKSSGLVWNAGIKVLVSTPTPTPTPTPTKIYFEPALYIQEFVNSVKIDSSKNQMVIFMHIEPGKNGPYPEIAESSLQSALDFYSSIGFSLPQKEYHVILGRTQDWLRQQTNIYAPGCVSSAYKFSGSAAPCNSPSRNTAVLYSHLPTAVTSATAAPDDIDLSNMAEILKYTNAGIVAGYPRMSPHEAFHAWQFGSIRDSETGGWPNLPPWFVEGGASIFAEMVYAKSINSVNAYLEYDSGAYSSWNKAVCIGPVETMKPVCEYTQGYIVMEYFLFKFGFDAYINIIIKAKSSDFSINFEKTTGTSLGSFYQDVNKYLSLWGWNS